MSREVRATDYIINKADSFAPVGAHFKAGYDAAVADVLAKLGNMRPYPLGSKEYEYDETLESIINAIMSMIDMK